MRENVAGQPYDPLLRSLAWLLASCIVALAAHGIIDLLGRSGFSADDYAARSHVAIAPVAIAATIFASTALLAVVARLLGRARSADAVLAAARVFDSMHTAVVCIAVALGALAILLGMEFSEQLCDGGRIEGIGDALGGNVATGLTVIAVSAILISIAFLRSIRTFVGAGVSVVRVLVAWVVVKTETRSPHLASRVYRIRHRRHSSASAFLARSSGLRAPPGFA